VVSKRKKRPAYRRAQSPGSVSSLSHTQYNASSRDNGKGNGFMHETNLWLDEVFSVIPDETQRKMAKKMIAGKIYDSYKNGRAATTK
jgi:hypothetical protein